MFDTLDFAQDLLTQQANLARIGHATEGTGLNRQHLAAIVSYQLLTDNWDEDGAIAPVHQTVLVAFDLAMLLTVAGQPIYHTSPGPVGEIMINLRNADKSVEFLIYPNDKRKIVRVGGPTAPWQGELTPETLRETLQWLNQ